MIVDEEASIAQVLRMVKEGKVRTLAGEDVAVKADTVCVHGDGVKACCLLKEFARY
jgi:UPF0271 protein